MFRKCHNSQNDGRRRRRLVNISRVQRAPPKKTDSVFFNSSLSGNPEKLDNAGTKKRISLCDSQQRRQTYEESIIYEENIWDMLTPFAGSEETKNQASNSPKSMQQSSPHTTIREEPPVWKQIKINVDNNNIKSYSQLLQSHRKKRAQDDTFPDFVKAKKDRTECFEKLKIPENFLTPELRATITKSAETAITRNFHPQLKFHPVDYNITILPACPSNVPAPKRKRRQGKGARQRAQEKQLEKLKAKVGEKYIEDFL